MRITVWDILQWRGAGAPKEEILDDHPELERADLQAVHAYAAEMGNRASRRLKLLLDQNLHAFEQKGSEVLTPALPMKIESATAPSKAAGEFLNSLCR